MPGYETAVVRLVRSDAARSTAGLGVLVGAREVVTCAHVVNAALGLGLREQARPAASALVRLEFPLLSGPPVREARVHAWVPPLQAGTGGGDVAGLVLNEDAPAGAVPARFAGKGPKPGGWLRVFGYPQDPPREDGAWVDVHLKGEVGRQLIQVESRGDQTTVKAQPGYSGSPVWDDSSGVVVGLLHATAFSDEPHRDAYLVSAGMVAGVWEEQFDYLLVPANPYRGLEPFAAEHASLFFGRDGDIDALTARVTAQAVVVVVGPSGVGKSSLVQAGLIPRLQRDQPWSVALLRPGQDPWYRLAAALRRAQQPEDADTLDTSKADIEGEIERLRIEGFGPTARFLRSERRPLLVVVDQFEELLEGGQPPEPGLLDLLLPRPEAADEATKLVHTLRADFMSTLLGVPGLASRLDQRQYLLSPLAEDQLRKAIEEPAKARDVKFQEGLVEQIIADAAAGSLPLLEFTLTRLWQNQHRRTLDFTGYHTMGGVNGALDRFANEQVSKLSTTEDVVDRVLLRLVRAAADDGESATQQANLATRQRVYRSDLPDVEWQTLRHLADARLVIVDADDVRGPYAELAHEALITSWERLHHLVGENALFLRWLDGIQRRAAEGDPLPESRIPEARRWVDARPNDIAELVKAFIDNSQIAAEARLRELTEARNRAETARQQAETARERAEAAARRAEALRLAADAEHALRSGATTVALALGAESILTEPTLQGDLALRRVLARHPRTLARLDHLRPVRAVVFAPDGTRVATGSDDRTARVFDAVSGAEVARLDHDGPVWAVVFAPDGTRVATGSGDRTARVFDAVSGAELAKLDHDGLVRAVAFAPDGTRVATGSDDRTARVFEAAGGAELSRLDHGAAVNAVAFAPDGTRVATASGDRTARVFDAASGAELARLDHDGPVRAVAFAPDGTWVATGSDDRTARVFDAVSGAELVRLDHLAPVQAVAFAPDGTRVATGSDDRRARVFDAVRGAELARLDHLGPVWAVVFAPDGTWVATASEDGTARVFDAAAAAELSRLDHGAPVNAVAFAPDGTRVASGSSDCTVRVFEAAAGAELSRLDHDTWIREVAFAPDGTRVATASGDRTARVFDAVSGAELARLDHDGPVRAVAFAPDGTRVATGSDDRTARVFDAVSGAELAKLDHDRLVWGVAFAPDSTRVATAGEDGTARVFDAAGGAELSRLDHRAAVNVVAFAPDGTRVATASDDESARVFDAATGAELSRLDHGSAVNAVAFAPDGTRVATASGDRTARVFEAATGAEVARLDHDGRVWAVAFAPDGTRVATGGDDRTARVFDAATGTELARLDHDDQVWAVAFAPDGTRVATASIDRTVRVFDAAIGAELAMLVHDGPVWAVAFAPDGTRVATGCSDGMARVFEVERDLLLTRVLALMTRPLNAAELRRYGLPRNCRHVQHWVRDQVAAEE